MNQISMFESLELPRNVREAKFLEFHAKYPIVYELWDQMEKRLK